jgi:hypothetical protein
MEETSDIGTGGGPADAPGTEALAFQFSQMGRIGIRGRTKKAG